MILWEMASLRFIPPWNSRAVGYNGHGEVRLSPSRPAPVGSGEREKVEATVEGKESKDDFFARNIRKTTEMLIG